MLVTWLPILQGQPLDSYTNHRYPCQCRLEHSPGTQGTLQQPLLHVATATARQACSLLALSALDLARFGPQLMADMQEYAGQRLQWRRHRMGICKDAAQVQSLLHDLTIRHAASLERWPRGFILYENAMS